jgi:hypothetical protein
MPRFTIEAAYRIAVYRLRTYETDTVEQACRMAVEDGDWSGQKEDYETTGDTYVSGAWPGADTAYRLASLPVPSQFSETVQRKAAHFEVLLGILKVLAHAPDVTAPDPPFWRQHADAAIAKAEAILAGVSDPD